MCSRMFKQTVRRAVSYVVHTLSLKVLLAESVQHCSPYSLLTSSDKGENKPFYVQRMCTVARCSYGVQRYKPRSNSGISVKFHVICISTVCQNVVILLLCQGYHTILHSLMSLFRSVSRHLRTGYFC